MEPTDYSLQQDTMQQIIDHANHVLFSNSGTSSVSGALTTSHTIGGTITTSFPALQSWRYVPTDTLVNVGYEQAPVTELKQDLMSRLEALIEMTEDDPDVCRFVKAAKATIDKRTLEKINEHLDGNSKPD